MIAFDGDSLDMLDILFRHPIQSIHDALFGNDQTGHSVKPRKVYPVVFLQCSGLLRDLHFHHVGFLCQAELIHGPFSGHHVFDHKLHLFTAPPLHWQTAV